MDATALQAFERDLRDQVRGDVMFDKATRGIYATDASNYQIEPIAVVLPRDEQDVLAAMATARKHRVSIISRGGGTSLGGQPIGKAMILDFSKYMDQVLELNVKERWVRVQPGVVRDTLNEALAKHGLQFAPDPATSSRANVGGIVGNNSSGTKSIIFGRTVDHVLAAKVALADGEVMELQALSPQEYEQQAAEKNRKGEILSRFKKIVEENREEVAARYPKTLRRVSGYNLDEFTQTDQWNLAKLICGSEGTLAAMLEIKLNLEELPKSAIVCVIHFAELAEAVRAVKPIVAHGPSAVEILDETGLTLARQNLATAPQCDFVEGAPAAVLIVEFYGETQQEVADKAEKLIADMKAKKFGYAYPIRDDAAGMARVWMVRKNGLGLILGMKGDRKPCPFIEDAAIPLDHLPEYIDQVLKFSRSLDIDVAMYAHASVGVIHVRPILDLRRQDDIERMKKIADYAFGLVKKYGGSWSSEHGDGLVRSPFIERFYGEKIYAAFKEIKRLFDPQSMMNPGKIVDPEPMDHNLRYGTAYRETPFTTEYHYLEDESFSAAVNMCTGVGECRKTAAGTMCPSYRATRDEAHSTRGRANALRMAMSGQLGPEGLASKELFDVLDLCLSCKACKNECPSNVDVAKLKSEFLQQYRDQCGTTRRDKMISKSRSLAAFNAGWKAPLVNCLQGTKAFRWVLEKVAGFDRRRLMPTFARRPFASWFDQRPVSKGPLDKKVVLFDDTYINYHEPHIGQKAVELLESCGYEVVLARVGCCQRPRISNGFLRLAKKEGKQTLRGLDAFITQGLQVVVCEPSCASALTDDLPDLLGDRELKARIRKNVMMIDVFLDQQVQAGKLDVAFTSPQSKLLIHGHCHQKALYGTGAMKSLLGKVKGLTVNEVDAGCCGMAGAFGYEKEHYDLSQKIGEERLFPAVRQLDKETQLVACGFSCRHQVADATGVRPLHWVETLAAKSG